MNKDEIIEIANKIKLPHDYVNGEPMWLDKLEEFAKLIAEREREACAECGADGGHALYCVACAEKYVNKGTRMTKEIYLKQYQEARGTVTMPNEPMWVDKWEVCVKFDSLEEARSFRNEIENPRPNFSITMRVKDNVPHTGIEKLNLTVRTERCLKAEDIISIEQLQCFTEERLLKTPNLGRKAINEIKEKMAEFGYKLRGQE